MPIEGVTWQQVAPFYWMNHCEHCEAKLGDFESLQEFDGLFHALGDTGVSSLLEIAEPFAAQCGSHTVYL